MQGIPARPKGLAVQAIACYLICSLVAAMLLTATVMLATADASHFANLAPWLGLLALAALGLGAWYIFRRLSPLSAIEAQLLQVVSDGSTASCVGVPVRSGASLGWNSLIEQLTSDTDSIGLVERLEEALAGHAGGEIEAALQSLGDGVAITDAEGRITFANRALAAILGDGVDDTNLRNSAFVELLTRNASDCDASLLNAEALHSVVGELSSNAGEKSRFLRAARHPLQGSGATGGAVWSIQDVTQQRLANQMRDQFLDSATHELRTPLANIKAYAETLALDDMLDVECQKDFCNTINAEATRLARLIDDLLDLSSMEVGSLSVTRANVELDRLLRDVLEKVTPLMESKSLKFEVALPDKLPEMQLDKDKIATTLVNLLGNAAKYTEAGGRVALRVNVNDNEVQIDIEDTGVGIAETDLPHLFEKFFRGADQRVQSETGTGLGLSIAFEIVRLHGGDIEVQSKLNQGSTFSVTLPLSEGA